MAARTRFQNQFICILNFLASDNGKDALPVLDNGQSRNGKNVALNMRTAQQGLDTRQNSSHIPQRTAPSVSVLEEKYSQNGQVQANIPAMKAENKGT